MLIFWLTQKNEYKQNKLEMVFEKLLTVLFKNPHIGMANHVDS